MAKGTAKGKAKSLCHTNPTGKGVTKPVVNAQGKVIHPSKQVIQPSRATGLCAGNKVKRSKHKQAVARYKAIKARLTGKLLAARSPKAQVKAQARLQALQAPVPAPVAKAPKRKPLPSNIKGKSMVQVTSQHKVWGMGTGTYSYTPVTHLGYLIGQVGNTAFVYIPARGKAPAQTIQASTQGTGVPTQYVVTKWYS